MQIVPDAGGFMPVAVVWAVIRVADPRRRSGLPSRYAEPRRRAARPSRDAADLPDPARGQLSAIVGTDDERGRERLDPMRQRPSALGPGWGGRVCGLRF